VLLYAAPFQVLRYLSDSTDPKWHNSSQETATELFICIFFEVLVAGIQVSF